MHTHVYVQCSLASVGLTQAHPNETKKPYTVFFVVKIFLHTENVRKYFTRI